MGNDNPLRELDAILVGEGGRVGDNLRWSSILWGGGVGDNLRWSNIRCGGNRDLSRPKKDTYERTVFLRCLSCLLSAINDVIFLSFAFQRTMVK